jgi:hypothetical protein
MWPLEDHFADKIAAMYERRGPDKRHSSRVKDLVDLDLIALKSPVSGPSPTPHCVPRYVAAKTSAPTSYCRLCSMCPTEHHGPALSRPSWQNPGYSGAVPNLDGVMRIADAFITPLLHSTPPAGAWSPADVAWR